MVEENTWWQTLDFDFIRIPKELFRNPYYGSLSPESRMLYGFLLDRMNLSWANGDKWRNSQGEPFVIFPLAEIQQRLNCGKNKAVALLKKLEAQNLIRRDRPKKDGPYHIVVNSFLMEVPKSNLPAIQSETCAVPKTKPAQVSKANLNNTDINKTDENNTDAIRQQTEHEIKKQIYYDILCLDLPRDKLDAIVEVMTDTLCSPADTVWISGAPRAKEAVRKRLLEADDMRIRYLFDHMKQNTSTIRSYRAYYLARLWEPEGMVDAFYENWVRRDLRSGR